MTDFDKQREAFSQDILGESRLRADRYKEFKQAVTSNARHEAFVDILRGFDEFCQSEGIGYFLFGSTLQGVITYEDFIPGDASIQLGMLQKDYTRLKECYQKTQAQDRWSYDWQLSRYLEDHPSVRRRFPRLQISGPVSVHYDGQQIFTEKSLPLMIEPYIEISIFNAVPDDFYTRKKFFRQMQRRNDLYETTIEMRQILHGKRPGKAVSLFSGMLAILVPLRFTASMICNKAHKYEGKGMLSVVRVRGAKRTKTVELTDILPYQRLKLHGIEVNCPANPDIWAPAPIDEPTEELRRLQEAAIRIVTEIDRVCQQLNIGYFICGGTLLGHVRHGGFIPWDDDIDVGMPRADYERFMKEAPAVLDAKTFFLQTRESDPNIPYLFSKVRLNGSSYVTEYNQFRDFHKGICVDIFPFDAVPDDQEELKTFRAQVYRKVKAHNHVVNRQYPPIESPTKPKKNLDWLIAQTTGHLLARHYWNVSLKETQQEFNDVVQSYNDQAAESIACFVPSYTMIRREDLLPYQRVGFEGITVNIPADPDIFLSMQYGDYMALPPRHTRRGHELLEWSIEADDFDNGKVG